MNLIHGDCIDEMKRLDACSVDLTVTSPPYDNLRSYNGQDAFTFDKFKEVANELFRVSKVGGVVVWVVADQTKKGTESGSSFKQALYFKEAGFNLHDTMIWQKDSCPFPDKTRYYNVFEYMFVFSKGRPGVINQLKDRKNKHFGLTRKHREYDRRSGEVKTRVGAEYKIKEYGVRYNIWNYGVGCGKTSSNFGHPAVFPENLAKDHILSWSNENDIVMDPFMGAGTTCKIAKILGRNFIGIEKDSNYFNIAKKRISDA